MLVLRADDLQKAKADLLSMKLIHGLTQIIAHNKEIVRITKKCGEMSMYKMYMLYFGITLRQLYEVRV